MLNGINANENSSQKKNCSNKKVGTHMAPQNISRKK